MVMLGKHTPVVERVVVIKVGNVPHKIDQLIFHFRQQVDCLVIIVKTGLVGLGQLKNVLDFPQNTLAIAIVVVDRDV